MKKITVLFAVICFCFISFSQYTTEVHAEEIYSETKSFDFESNNIVTFEEMVSDIAAIEGKSEYSVRQEFIDSELVRLENKIGNYSQRSSNLRATASANLRAAQYITNKWKLKVDRLYHPTLVIYALAETSTRTVNKIMRVSMDRNSSYLETSKQFNGEIYYNLETNKTLHVEVNGEFLKNGTTAVTTGTEIGIGGEVTLKFSASSTVTSNHYAYYFNIKKYPLVVNLCHTDPLYIC